MKKSDIGLNELNVENIVIYISDALRWDYLPERIRTKGITAKTVSAGCATMESVSSILTGQYPFEHGVRTWYQRLNKPNLLDWEDGETGFYNAAGSNDGLNLVLNIQDNSKLTSLSEPFIYIERDHGGHSPYIGAGYNQTQKEMVSEIGGKTEIFRERYKEAIEASVNRFLNRLNTLKNKNSLDKTLAIFTSDHGELLGEYGLVSHGSPPTPELVYVPTTFIHPSFQSQEIETAISHVDIVKLINDALNDNYSLPISDSILTSRKNNFCLNFSSSYINIADKQINIYSARSVWDKSGGHVFNQKGRWSGPIIGYNKANRWGGKYWRSNPKIIIESIKKYSNSKITYGNPCISKDKAKELLKDKISQEKENMKKSIPPEVEKKLENLGYL